MMHGLSSARVEIRACRPADIAGVLALWALARSDHAVTADRAEDVERLLADGEGALHVAEREGEIIGALIAAWDGWRGNLYRLAVHPTHRRRGIASALLLAGEQHLRRAGARRVTALVAYDDAEAGAFWDATGYPQDQEIGRRVKNLPANGDSISHFHRMEI
jgi:ribosomal protein S18 acetylase RimI-like enzyme